jgi:hypothetical protein
MSTSDTTLETLVSAIAEQVSAKVKAEISARRSEQSVQHLIFQKDLPTVRVGRRVH